MRDVAQRWLETEPDEDVRAELRLLLDGDADELARRFEGQLEFGTAGLRAMIGAGPLRMNRLVVRQTAAGLGQYLLDTQPEAAERGVLIGFDARRKSDTFALDTALVLAAMGIRTRVLAEPLPTPVLAWAIGEVGAVAGVMVTASHNPPTDNGYKVYLGSGSQIVSPVDAEISERIGRVDACSVDLADEASPLVERLGRELVDGYLDRIAALRLRPDVGGVLVAYTPLHGVGGRVLLEAFAHAGFPPPIVVERQFQADAEFPTVSFPNPEEPGAMDMVIELAREEGAAMALANDPDADRLGVAIPTPDGGWRLLRGDEIGWLLADHILRNTDGDERLVVTTLVSSSLLGKLAAEHGVHYAETFTGFKWIGHEVQQRPDQRFVFGYEQALGYLVADRPLDKDGITAAVLMAEVASSAAADGVTLQHRLDELAARFGRHITAERSLKMDPAEGAARVAALRADAPVELNGAAVTGIEDYPEANLLRIMVEGGVRVQVRPSGTEPKVKLYGEAIDADPTPFVDALAALL
ncbi:MAG: phospho-sugar mutase [Actinomycetota bacterium]|nr:phospho-sugar mutase [Actinomycetota bacterium]